MPEDGRSAHAIERADIGALESQMRAGSLMVLRRETDGEVVAIVRVQGQLCVVAFDPASGRLKSFLPPEAMCRSAAHRHPRRAYFTPALLAALLLAAPALADAAPYFSFRNVVRVRCLLDKLILRHPEASSLRLEQDINPRQHRHNACLIGQESAVVWLRVGRVGLAADPNFQFASGNSAEDSNGGEHSGSARFGAVCRSRQPIHPGRKAQYG